MTTTINNEHEKNQGRKVLNVPNKREQNQTCLDSAEREGLRQKGNVPILRFPEFQGEWEKTKIGDIAIVVGGGTPDTNTSQYWNGKIQWFTPSEIGRNKYVYNSVRTISEEGLNKSSTKLLPIETILLSSRATVGECSINKKECTTNQGFQSLIPKENISNEFVYYLIQTKRKDLIRKSCGSTFLEISANEVRKIVVSIPSIKEQDKIAKLLSLLDDRIATQNKIIEDLKKLKAAIVEKVLCSPNQEYPMCRIEGFEQALSTYKMSDFSSRIATKNKDSKCSLVLTIAAQYGLVNQESFFNKSVASENLTGYYLLHKGEFAYNRSYSAGYDWGVVKRLDNYDEGVLSTLYICFKINETIVDSDYLAYYFESSKWHKGLSDIAGEGARNHGLLNVSMTDYFNTKHRFPVIEEQKAIAKMLNTIAEKERKATLLGECYQKQKQYLLCQMFT